MKPSSLLLLLLCTYVIATPKNRLGSQTRHCHTGTFQFIRMCKSRCEQMCQTAVTASPDTKEARQVSGYLRKPGVVCGVMVGVGWGWPTQLLSYFRGMRGGGSRKRTGQLESCTRRRNLVTKSIHVRFVPRRDFRITGLFITHCICSSIIAAVQLVVHRQRRHGCSAQVLALQLEFPSHRCLFLPAAQARGRMSGMLGVGWWKGGGRDMLSK